MQRLKPLFSILLMLWSSFAMTAGIGVIVVAIMEVIVTDVSLWDALSGNDVYASSSLFTVPCLIALLMYLLIRLFWEKAYIIYIALIGLILVLLGSVWIMNGDPAYTEGDVARAMVRFFMIGIALASPIAFFATRMVRSQRKLITATIIGIIYISMYAYVGFAL